MEQPTNGQNSTGETVDEQIRKNADAAFMAEFQELQKKHKRVLIPVINSSKLGIMPGQKLITEEEYQAVLEKAAGIHSH